MPANPLPSPLSFIPSQTNSYPVVKLESSWSRYQASRRSPQSREESKEGFQNGAHIYFTVAFKPPATNGLPQNTVSYDEIEGVLEAKGRHDMRWEAIPIVEAMSSLVLMDALLAQKARKGVRDALVSNRRTAAK
jgi:chorismate synthase